LWEAIVLSAIYPSGNGDASVYRSKFSLKIVLGKEILCFKVEFAEGI
jgi:hypothetical protein